MPSALAALGLASADAELSRRLTWLTALRLSVLTAALVISFGTLGPDRFTVRVAIFTLAGAYALAGLYALLLRVGLAGRRIAVAQLVTDQLTWTALVYVTGGVTSGASSLYGLTALTGAVLLGLPGALVAAGAGALSYVTLSLLLMRRVLVPPPDQPLDLYVRDWSELRSPFFVTLLAIGMVTALASYLAERLRATGGRLHEATVEVAEARLRAEKAEQLALLGQIAAGLAHEIRNPLGAIAGSIELLRAGNLSKEDAQLCDIVATETTRLSDLVTDMLDLARPRPIALERVDALALAREVVTLAGSSGRGVSDVGVSLESALDEAPTVADPAQLKQVVWNLVRNAVQASQPGGRVLVRLEREGDELTLAVEDHGAGIPESARASMFDAFFTTRAKGTGIGLAVVKRIVDEHGFGIEVESEEGAGTTFRVRMPAA